MYDFIIPPPKEPARTKEEFRRKREAKVEWLIRHGYLQSGRIRDASLIAKRLLSIERNLGNTL